MGHIKKLSGDASVKVMDKVSAYLSAQPPCKQNFFTARSTASGRCEQRNGILRALGFTKSSSMLQALSNLRDKVNSQFHRYLERSVAKTSKEWNCASVADESVLSMYSEAVFTRLEDEFKQSKRGYSVDPLGGDRYKVSYAGDDKEHMPHTVSWHIEKNSLGTPIPTCTCSLHTSGGYPCRHIIIVVAVARREKIKISFFFNDRLERDQVPFIEGRKLASVNYTTA